MQSGLVLFFIALIGVVCLTNLVVSVHCTDKVCLTNLIVSVHCGASGTETITRAVDEAPCHVRPLAVYVYVYIYI